MSAELASFHRDLEQAFPEREPMNKDQQIQQLETALSIIRDGLDWEADKWKDGKWARPASDPIQCLFHGYKIRVKPWQLGRSINGHVLPEGMEWAGSGWTKCELPAPFRPHYIGERDKDGDQFIDMNGRWSMVHSLTNIPTEKYMCKRRTTRPIPTPDPYAELKAAQARGEVIQVREKGSTGAWYRCDTPEWLVDSEYRIAPPKPSPVLVPLGPDDIRAGDEFISPKRLRYQWLIVGEDEVVFAVDFRKTYAKLMVDGWRYRHVGGEWQACSKEARP